MTARLFKCVAVCGFLLLSFPAYTQWVDGTPTGKDDILMAAGYDLAGSLYVSGLSLETSGGAMPIPIPKPRFMRSVDNAKTWQDLSRQIGSGGLTDPNNMVQELHMFHQWEGVVAVNKSIAYQEQLGKWNKVDLGARVNGLHMFDESKGVACGDDGHVWTTNNGGRNWNQVVLDEPTNASFLSMHCIKNGQCFMAAQISQTVEEEGVERHTYPGWEVWAGTDFGQSWTKGFSVSGLINDGQLVGPIFFLDDGKTGWVVFADYNSGEGRNERVYVAKSTDGGKTIEDIGLDTQVGTLQMFGSFPVYFNHVAAMYWADANRGRLVGSAFVIKISGGGGGGGGDGSVFRRIDMETTDGGATWTKPEPIYIESGMIGGSQNIPSDPRPIGGRFQSWVQGVVVGEKGLVQLYQKKCDRDSVCGVGYKCDRTDLICVEDPDFDKPDDPPPCTDCEEPDPQEDRDVITGDDTYNPSDTTSRSDLAIPNIDDDEDSKGGGCTTSTNPSGLGLMIIGLLMGFVIIRRRLTNS
ncbi:MAG: WD40/YVTN/BNR-like repeat-containing protein [Myxococcota bacterium]|jgi:hypothetical protein